MKIDKNKFEISNLSLQLATTSALILLVLMSFPTQGVFAQGPAESSGKDIKFQEYTDPSGLYKISYPSDAKIVLDSSLRTITEKNREWEFKVYPYGHLSNVSSFEEHVNYEKQAINDAGNKILEKKPLTVGGFPAVMISSLDDETKTGKLATLYTSLTNQTEKGKLKFIEIVVHLPNDYVYEFYISSSVDKFDQYAPIFFTMLKSFKLTNVSEGNEVSDIISNTNVQVSGMEDLLPVVKSSKVLEFTGDNYGDMVNSVGINLDSFTVSTWFDTEMDVDVIFEAFLINKGIVDKPGYLTQSNLNFGLYLTEDEQISGGFEDSMGRNYIITSSGSYNDGNWHQAVLTFDQPSHTLKLYIDGIEGATDTTDPKAKPDTAGDTSIRLGASNLSEEENVIDGFIGQLDDIQVWDVAFTNEEVIDLFNTESKLSR